MSKLTVFGSGNGGVTCAYHCAKNGHEIIIYDFNAFDKQICAINSQGGVRAVESEHGESMLMPGFQPDIKGTHDIKEACAFSNIYILACPSFAQERFFSDMIPYLKNGTIIITFAANYASLVFTQMLKDAGVQDLDIVFCDCNTLPWACRLSQTHGSTCISGIKKYIPTAIFPKSRDENGEISKILDEVMPIPVMKLENILAAGLENINIGGHPLYCTVNMGLLETLKGNVNYYKDCCSPATSKAQDKLEEERLSVGKAFGLNLERDIDMVNKLYGTNEVSSYAFNQHSVAHAKLGGAPSSSKHRYITEDIPYSMVPLHELAEVAGLKVPVCTACITLGSAYNDEDYLVTGRTLKKLGLEGLSKEEILNVIDQ